MLDIVSFETAKQLKEAGFPQPSARFGQFWYDETSEALNCIGFEDFSIWFEDLVLEGYIFAPTATDILRLLPGVYLCVNDKSIWRAEWAGVSCYDNDPPLAKGEAPAEVAAAAWLLLKVRHIDLKITGNLNA